MITPLHQNLKSLHYYIIFPIHRGKADTDNERGSGDTDMQSIHINTRNLFIHAGLNVLPKC